MTEGVNKEIICEQTTIIILHIWEKKVFEVLFCVIWNLLDIYYYIECSIKH